jgi:hypothetical protein
MQVNAPQGSKASINQLISSISNGIKKLPGNISRISYRVNRHYLVDCYPKMAGDTSGSAKALWR